MLGNSHLRTGALCGHVVLTTDGSDSHHSQIICTSISPWSSPDPMWSETRIPSAYILYKFSLEELLFFFHKPEPVISYCDFLWRVTCPPEVTIEQELCDKVKLAKHLVYKRKPVKWNCILHIDQLFSYLERRHRHEHTPFHKEVSGLGKSLLPCQPWLQCVIVAWPSSRLVTLIVILSRVMFSRHTIVNTALLPGYFGVLYARTLGFLLFVI